MLTVREQAVEVDGALDRVGANGWTPTMLIAGALLAEALGTDSGRAAS